MLGPVGQAFHIRSPEHSDMFERIRTCSDAWGYARMRLANVGIQNISGFVIQLEAFWGVLGGLQTRAFLDIYTEVPLPVPRKLFSAVAVATVDDQYDT